MRKINFFLSHSSDDKKMIVQPVANALGSLGMTVWVDEAELTVGDSLVGEIQNALISCDLAVVFISKSFLSNGWSMEELKAMLNIQLSKKTKFVLPVVIDIPLNELQDTLPFIAEKKYIPWNNNPQEIANKLLASHKKYIKIHSATSSNEKPRSRNYMVLPKEVEEQIDMYRNHIARNEFGTAFHIFFERPNPENSLNYVLDFVYSRCDDHLDLLSDLFKDIKSNPHKFTPSQRAKVFNAHARAYKNTGQLDDAIKTFRQQIDIEVPTHESGVHTYANFINALRLAGRLYEATDLGHQLLRLSHDETPKSIGYSLYWNGIVAAAKGFYKEAELLLRQAEQVFEAIAEDDKYRGLGRTYAHIALLELWLGNASIAWPLANQSHLMAENHGESRETIFTSRLMGMASLAMGNYQQSEKHLTDAQNKAQDVGYLEEELEATIGLAELDSRDGKLTMAEQKLRDVERRAHEGRYRLLRVDSLNALTQVFRESGRCKQAIKAALNAYQCACCDNRPYAYERGLLIAGQHLVELNTELPVVCTVNGARLFLPQNDSSCDKPRRNKAHLRYEFAENLRIIRGSYRYAPTKFIKLLREDWQAVCQIVKKQPVTLTPQYVEIHVEEHCNLSCFHCRGELRKVPNREEKFLPAPELKCLIDEIQTLNNKAFIRFSGLIGEPFIHPNIIELFNYTSQKGLRWGVTTNGVKMAGEVINALMNADYVHISLDAGSNKTYQELKNGMPNDFDTVLQNVKDFLRQRESCASMPQLIVSVLLQNENISELQSISQHLKEIGVDSLEIKMQHFDKRRRMSKEIVEEAYSVIEDVRRLDDGGFRVVVVQTKEQAFNKIRKSKGNITFSKCYANELGLNATVDPDGNLQTCCQYYQETLGKQGSLTELGFSQVWRGESRTKILGLDPRYICVNCSPSDEFVNKFVSFLSRANSIDSDFLRWAEKQITLILEHEFD